MIRKLVAYAIATLLVVGHAVTPAAAEIRNLQESALDTFTPIGTPSNFDAISVAYAEFSDSPDFHYFFVDFEERTVSDQFNDGAGSWAMVMIDINSDNKEDFRVETTRSDLEGNFAAPAAVFDVNRGRQIDDCSAGFYSDLDDSVSWIGFRLPYNCLKLPGSFGIRAYADYIADDGAAFDYVPESSFFKVTHSISASAPASALGAPRLAVEPAYSVPTPGAAPDDLVALSPKVLKSVVTVYCGQGLGTGWAAKVDIPNYILQQGMTTFLVTNHHVIEDCLASGEVTVTDVNGNSAVGLLAAVDEKNDLAGIYTKLQLPALSFRGERPAQGWWVGVLGSPRGLDGYLTTGLVSKVAQDGSEFGVSASLNPGNSGGPIFDREGRVLGVATYKISDSEGLGFARSSQLLCQKVLECGDPLSIWLTNLRPKPTQEAPQPTPIPTASPTPTAIPSPTPNPAPLRTKVATLPAFSAKSSKLNSTQQNSINRQLVLNDWVTKFICTGVISSNASQLEKSLARARAKAACDFAVKRNPGLATFFQTKSSSSKSSVGKVLITLKE